MSDGPPRVLGTPTSTDRVERLINEQLRIMEKQLELMRSVEAAEGAANTQGHSGVAAKAATQRETDWGIDREGAPESPPSGTPPGSAPPPPAEAAPSRAPAAPVATEGKRVPMADVQRDVWVNCQLGSESAAAYNLSTVLRLKGDLNVDALDEALRRLVQRHESLRTTFDPTGGIQIVRPTADIGMLVVNLSDSPESERARRVAEFIDSEMSGPYDLVNGPLFRATLIRMGVASHMLVLSAHHLVCDGWSFGVMKRDLGALYSAATVGGHANLEAATQYSEYADWCAEQSVEAEPYWLRLYDDPPVQLDLPTDGARSPLRAFDFAADRTIIDKELLAALKGLAAAHGVTPFVVLLAAWETLLHRLSGQREFTSGVFVSGQASMGVRNLVGLCANLLPLRVEITPDERLAEYLTRLKHATFDALDNQHYTVGKLASALHLRRDPSRPAVVSAAITLETPTRGIDFEGLEAVESRHGRRKFGSFDLEAYLTESNDDLTVDLHYSSALFDSDTIQRWLGYYLHLLRQMKTGAAATVSDLQLMDDAERREILVKWNDTQAPIPNQSPRERFELQAARHPDRVAIQTSGRSLTYRELNARANRLARHLRGLGVESERLVGVHVNRSPDMVIALLAVHKAAGAFVPLDPLFPIERLTTIADDSGLHVLVTQQDLAGDIRVGGAATVLLDGDASSLETLDDSDLEITPAPSDLAYVISTSGSTGKPKGVEITHLALTNQLDSMLHEPGLEPDDVVLAVTTMSFDPALLEFFLPLMVGATIVLADAQEAVDAVWLRDRLAVNDITVMQATPATWQMLLDAGWPGTPYLKALCGGEALSQELAVAISSRVASLWNVYGTTETTIWSSASKVSRDGGLIPLGPPIANTEFHVLDPWLEPQPPGIIGGLYIGGVGLARGYRNQPSLTEDRFFMHSFDDGPPRRLYRTGDLARRLADGRIEFLGRDDFQVKIRGFRIELGEVEIVLARHPGVSECAVVARADANGTKRLVAYVVPTDDRHDNVSELRMYLRAFLPEYMVPSLFVELEAMPLSANKKVDRSRLPDPDHQRPDLATELVKPRTETEAALARIWEKLLTIEQVGIEDNFFDLGGDSLLALRSMVEANRFGISLTPNSIFQYQTIAELALVASEAAESDADEQGVVIGALPLTPSQLRFLNERNTPDAHYWNLSRLVQAEQLSPIVLRTALDELIRHHDALRLRLWQEEGDWRQEIAAPPEEVPLESHDLSDMSAPQRIATIERVCSGLQESFDLGQGLLLRAAHFDCGPNELDRLFVTIHHFAVDGLTWSVFWEDFEHAYRQAAAGLSVALPPKTTSIRSWSMQLERLVQTPRIVDTAAEWLRLPWHEVAKVPADLEADPRSNTNGSTAVVGLELSPDSTRSLIDSRKRPEHVIITALARCLSGWTSSRTVLIDVLGHGRDAVLERVNLSRTVGFTLSYNPLVLSHPTWDGTPETLGAVVAQIEDGPEGFSFELLRFLATDEGLRNRLTALPRAELLFNYTGAVARRREDALWRSATEPTGPADSPRAIRQYPIAVRAELVPNLRLTFVYSTALHTASTIEAKVAEVDAAIRGLVGEALVTP